MSIRNTLIVPFVIVTVLTSFVGISAYKTRSGARTLLNEFRMLGTSKDPTASFEALRSNYGTKLRTIEGCSSQLCQYEMILSNKDISALRIVPYVELDVWYTVYKGSLLNAMLEYRTALPGSNSPVLHVQQGMCARGCGVRFDVNPHGTSQQMWNGLVEFDTRATPQQRDAALALNLDCLTRIGGCKDIVDLLPGVWIHSGPWTVSTRLVGLSQQLEESHKVPSSDDL